MLRLWVLSLAGRCQMTATFREMREKAQNHPHLAADPLYGRLVMRRLSPYLTWLTVRYTSLSADAVTMIAIASGVAAAIVLLFSSTLPYLAAVLLLQFSYLCDTFDGEVARVRGTASKRGTYLDLVGHVIQNRALFATSGVVFARTTDYSWWALAIVLLGLSFAAPFGYQSRLTVVGNSAAALQAPSDGETNPHARPGSLRWPVAVNFGDRVWWLYRRLSFIWAYPALMNSYCVALIADAVRFAAGADEPIILPAFTALFLVTLALKQVGNAVNLLRSDFWRGVV